MGFLRALLIKKDPGFPRINQLTQMLLAEPQIPAHGTDFLEVKISWLRCWQLVAAKLE